eukprot:Em0588g3a
MLLTNKLEESTLLPVKKDVVPLARSEDTQHMFNIYARTAESSNEEPLLCPPATLMSHVISHVIGHTTAKWPVGVQPAVELSQCYRTQLCDHVQAETLLGLGTGTYCYRNSGNRYNAWPGDLMKWAGDWNVYDDLDYKRETILSLASLPVSDAQKKLGDPKIAEVLLSNPQEKMLFRFPVQESWCELMEAMSSVAKGATGVILARLAGPMSQRRCGSSSRVHRMEGGSVVNGLKYSIVAGGVVMKKSLEQLQQLSAHLQSPQEDISMELFTKVLSCSASELSERLSLNQPAKCVREVAQQLFDGGFKATAGSLVLSTQQFHPNTQHPHCQ